MSFPRPRSCEKINNLTQRRQGAKTRKEQVPCFLRAFYDFAPLREMLLLIQGLFQAFRVPAPPDWGMLVAVSNEKAKEWSRNAFNRRAAKYEKTLAGWHSRKMKEVALRHVDRPIQGSLLDVGCGPGLLLEVLAGQAGEVNLAGLDIAPEMIRVAKERLGDRADLRVGDAEWLPWEDGRFDYLLCVDSFHHYPNPERVLTQMHRVLKRSGRLVIADPWAPPVLRQMANLVNPLLRMGDVRMYGKRDMMRMLEARGFEKTKWETSGLWGFVVTALAR